MPKGKKQKEHFTFRDYASVRAPFDNIYKLIKAGKGSEAEEQLHILVENIRKLMYKDLKISD